MLLPRFSLFFRGSVLPRWGIYATDPESMSRMMGTWYRSVPLCIVSILFSPSSPSALHLVRMSIMCLLGYIPYFVPYLVQPPVLVLCSTQGNKIGTKVIRTTLCNSSRTTLLVRGREGWKAVVHCFWNMFTQQGTRFSTFFACQVKPEQRYCFEGVSWLLFYIWRSDWTGK